VKHLEQLLFDARRYDLSRVGRYKYNKKLGLATRLNGQTLSRPIADPMTGEIVAEAGELISRERAHSLEDMGVDSAWVRLEDREVKILSNGMVNIKKFIDFDVSDLGINEK
ncbi:MAG: DNA-directed RNA polymerase subunit beta, partial [Angelakisella sp.]